MTAVDLIEFHRDRAYCSASLECLRASDPNRVIGADDAAVIKYLLWLPLQMGDPAAIELGERIRSIEVAHAAHRLDLAERAEAAAFGKTFIDDPQTRWSKAWCKRIAVGRHDTHADEWGKSGDRIASVLEETADAFAMLKQDQLALLSGRDT